MEHNQTKLRLSAFKSRSNIHWPDTWEEPRNYGALTTLLPPLYFNRIPLSTWLFNLKALAHVKVFCFVFDRPLSNRAWLLDVVVSLLETCSGFPSRRTNHRTEIMFKLVPFFNGFILCTALVLKSRNFITMLYALVSFRKRKSKKK